LLLVSEGFPLMASRGPRDDMLLHQGAAAMHKKFASYLILSLAFSMFMAASLAARQTPQTWVTYTPPSGKFTAQFPAEPKPDHQTSKDGGLTTEVYTYMWADKGVVLVASYMDLDANATPSADADLKAVQDNLVQGAGGKVLKSTRTEFPRGPNELLPTLQFTGETDTSDIKGAAIFDVYHIYMLLTLCPKDQQCAATTLKFLTSFKLNSLSVAKTIPAPAPAPAVNSARQTPQTWVTYTPPSGKFTAQFPTQPSANHQTTHDGGQNTEVYTYGTSDNGVVLIASYMDLDANATPSADADLKAVQDNLVRGAGGKVLESTRTEFPRGPNDTLPTLQFTGESDTSSMRGAVIFDAYHIYMLLTLCPKDQQCDASTLKFLTSFKLNPVRATKSNPAPAPSPTPSAAAPHATQETGNTWVKFTSAEGKFSALFPLQPTPDHKTTNTQGQTIVSNYFLAVDKRVVFGASYTDYDPKATYPVEDGMKAERDALLKGLTGGDAKLLTNTRTEFPRGATEKLPSLVFTAATSEQTVKAMVVVDDHRVYIVMVLCPKTMDASADMAKFFSSFKLTP
jgi:hypothetical protein